MKHEELKENDLVIFKRYCDILKKNDYQDGNVIRVRPDSKMVDICWLEGYQSRIDTIDYKNVIAKHDRNGQVMRFGAYVGNSVLLKS